MIFDSKNATKCRKYDVLGTIFRISTPKLVKKQKKNKEASTEFHLANMMQDNVISTNFKLQCLLALLNRNLDIII